MYVEVKQHRFHLVCQTLVFVCHDRSSPHLNFDLERHRHAACGHRTRSLRPLRHASVQLVQLERCLLLRLCEPEEASILRHPGRRRPPKRCMQGSAVLLCTCRDSFSISCGDFLRQGSHLCIPAPMKAITNSAELMSDMDTTSCASNSPSPLSDLRKSSIALLSLACEMISVRSA